MTRADIPGVVAILLVGAYAGLVAVYALRRMGLPPAEQTPDRAAGDSPDQKAAFDLLAAYQRDYAAYHGRKENMAWLVGTLGVGAGATAVVRGELFSRLKEWPDVVFWAFFALCLATALAVLLLLRFQNISRQQGAAILEAAANTYVHWLDQGARIPSADLTPTPRFDNPRQQLPAAVARRYAELLVRAKPSIFERLGYLVVGGWGVAALLRIVWARFGS